MSKKVQEIKGLKRGYKATIKNKKYNFGDGKHVYEVIELAGPKMDKPRIFVDEESVRLFIERNEGIAGLEKAFTNAVKRASTKSERKEMQAAKELEELLSIDLATNVDANLRDSKAKRPEDTDK
jgi:hypothetical protein